MTLTSYLYIVLRLRRRRAIGILPHKHQVYSGLHCESFTVSTKNGAPHSAVFYFVSLITLHYVQTHYTLQLLCVANLNS